MAVPQTPMIQAFLETPSVGKQALCHIFKGHARSKPWHLFLKFYILISLGSFLQLSSTLNSSWICVIQSVPIAVGVTLNIAKSISDFRKNRGSMLWSFILLAFSETTHNLIWMSYRILSLILSLCLKSVAFPRLWSLRSSKDPHISSSTNASLYPYIYYYIIYNFFKSPFCVFIWVIKHQASMCFFSYSGYNISIW